MPPAVTLYEYDPGSGPRIGSAPAIPKESVTESAFLTFAKDPALHVTGTPETGSPLASTTLITRPPKGLPPPTTPSKKSPFKGIRLAATPLGPKNRYGIRSGF